jgi:hypothetical protein
MMNAARSLNVLLLSIYFAAAFDCLGQGPFLDSALYTNGQFRFTVHGESKAGYIVLTSTNLMDWSAVATNLGNASNRKLIFTNSLGSVSWKVRRLPLPWFNFAMAAQGKIDVNGINFYVDSFDSSDPAYSGPVGSYDPSKHKANGDITTSAGLTNSVNIGNAQILGHILTGPGGSIDIGSYGVVGDLNWFLSGHTGAQAGYIRDDMNFNFAPAPVPPGGGMPMGTGGTVNGVIYNYILGNGNYEISSLSLNGNGAILITGTNTILYVRSDVSLTGYALIRLAPGAAFKLFVGGTSISLGGNGIINPGSALNLTYYGLGNNSTLSLSGNSTFTGVIYAPSTDISLGNGYSSNDFVGAIVAKTISLSGPVRVHFDESLQRFGPTR